MAIRPKLRDEIVTLSRGGGEPELADEIYEVRMDEPLDPETREILERDRAWRPIPELGSPTRVA